MVQVVQVNYFAHRKRKMQVCGAMGREGVVGSRTDRALPSEGAAGRGSVVGQERLNLVEIECRALLV